MIVRTPCGHNPTRRAEFLYLGADGARVELCGRAGCERAYQFDGATQIRDAEGRRGAAEKSAPNAGEHVGSGAGAVDAVLAPSFQSSLWEA